MLTHITDALELLGLLLLILAAALFVASLAGAPAGCAVAGLGLLVASWLITRTGKSRRS
jgi:hypothetical protein